MNPAPVVTAFPVPGHNFVDQSGVVRGVTEVVVSPDGTVEVFYIDSPVGDSEVYEAHEAGDPTRKDPDCPGTDRHPISTLTETERRKAIALIQGLWLDSETHLTVAKVYVNATIDEENNRIEVRVDAPVPEGRAHLYTRYWVHFTPKWQGPNGRYDDVRITPVGAPVDFSKEFPPGVYG